MEEELNYMENEIRSGFMKRISYFMKLIVYYRPIDLIVLVRFGMFD